MPTAQELKTAREALNAQIVTAEQEECEAKEARLQAEEEARVAAEMARLEEEERVAGPSQDKGKGRAPTSEEV